MELLKKLLWLCAIVVCTALPLHTVSAATPSLAHNWYWISSDADYSKFFDTKNIKVIAVSDGVPTLIQAYVKTGYSPAGAAATVRKINTKFKNPTTLNYSIARVWVAPQTRTIRYVEEKFYNKQGDLLATDIPVNPIRRVINSQSFNEKFYTYIVDQVFHQGETAHLNAKDRWLTIWDNKTGDNAADTSSLYQKGDIVNTWLWRENKDGGNVTSIVFANKEFNLKDNNLRTLYEKRWTPENGWKVIVNTPDTRMRVPAANSVEAMELAKIRSYALRNPAWTYRYQIYNPTQKSRVPVKVNTVIGEQEKTTAPTKKVVEKSKITKDTKTINTTKDVKDNKVVKPAAKKATTVDTPATKPATTEVKPATKVPTANDNEGLKYDPDEALGTYGPIGPVEPLKK